MSFRFNNGRGAITCDRCNIIVKYGYYTPEQHPSPHYCEDFGLECEQNNNERKPLAGGGLGVGVNGKCTDKGDNNEGN